MGTTTLNIQDHAEGLCLQTRSRNPIAKRLNMFTRRKIRRGAKVLRNPMRWMTYHRAFSDLPVCDMPFSVREADGFAAIPPDFIDGIEDVSKRARDIWRANKARMVEDETYFIKFTKYVSPTDINFIMDVLMQPKILRLAADYFGELPVLKDMNLWWTRPWSKATGAQNYHIDSIPDTKSLRFLISLTDVDDECGPVHAISAADSLALVNRTGYVGGGLSPEYVNDAVGPDAVRKFTGPVGSGVAVDTARCFHFGSRDMRKDRLVLSISISTCMIEEDYPDQRFWAEGYRPLNHYETLVLS